MIFSYRRANAVLLSTLITAGLIACGQDDNKPTTQTMDDNANPAPVAIDPNNDPRVWLEAVESEEALNWVRGQNDRTNARLLEDKRYQGLFDQALKLLESEDRIPYGSLYGGYVWNFWRDADHSHGLWRRTTLDSYLTEEPQWDTVLDLDALSAQEDANWVWRGANCLAPQYERCMITLSPGGSDAAVRREFSISERAFVADGFVTPEAKGTVAWVDDNTLLIGLATDEDNSTASGYPFVTYRWSRGTALTDAAEILRSQPSDVGLWPERFEDHDGGVYMMAAEADTFYESQYWYLPEDSEPRRLPIPAKTSVRTLFKGQLVFSLAEDWQPDADAATLPSGALVSFSLPDFISSGELPTVHTLYIPTKTQSLGSVAASRDALLVAIDDKVVGGVSAFRFDDTGWRHDPLPVPDNLTISLGSTSRELDMAFINAEGFLTPDTLLLADSAAMTVRPVKSIPERFAADGLVVEQREVASKDGTLIPYFVVRKADTPMDGSTPTLLYAYGGFQVSIRPSYSGSRGKLWLERGGAYVVANIRGGGEFGPAWHQAGLKTQRQRIYDDLIAVAEDLDSTGLTRPGRLAVYGGSNGGLLTGVMYTQRPDLWGAVVSAVPLLDMLRYHTLLAGASWMGEYGDPEDATEGAFLRSISPYHNVYAEKAYPEIYIYTSTKDDRVHPGHARKMAHLLESLGHDYLYYENIDGGHAAAANLNEYARRDAMLYTFLMQKLMDPPAEQASAP